MTANYSSLVWNAILDRGCTDPVDLQDFLDRNAVGVNLENEHSWSRFLIERHRNDGSVWIDRYYGGLCGCTPEEFSYELADALSEPQMEIYLCCGENKSPRRLCRSEEGTYQLSDIVSRPNGMPRKPCAMKRILHRVFGAYRTEFDQYQDQMLASQLWQMCAGQKEPKLEVPMH